MARFGIGQPVTRKEDVRFLTGRGRYVADIDLVRQAYAVFLFSPHAHARIRSIDKAAAEQVPGIFAVLTGEDWAGDGLGTLDPEAMAEDMGGPQGFRTEHPPLAIDRVRYVGERVAVVIWASEAKNRQTRSVCFICLCLSFVSVFLCSVPFHDVSCFSTSRVSRRVVKG